MSKVILPLFIPIFTFSLTSVVFLLLSFLSVSVTGSKKGDWYPNLSHKWHPNF